MWQGFFGSVILTWGVFLAIYSGLKTMWGSGRFAAAHMGGQKIKGQKNVADKHSKKKTGSTHGNKEIKHGNLKVYSIILSVINKK